MLFQLETLETNCLAIGKLWPKLFLGSSIPPKVDVLVFVVPKFARKWGTLGGLAEERIEALHQTFNRFDRVLACIPNKGKADVIAMKRVRALKVAKAKVGNISMPRKRIWKNIKKRQERYRKK